MKDNTGQCFFLTLNNGNNCLSSIPQMLKAVENKNKSIETTKKHISDQTKKNMKITSCQ